MKMFKFAALALGAVLSLAVTATPAQAQATRTWVSGVGDDANPCSRTAPCKTFAGAISKTAVGGEINCLDPAGYGAVTITKSITIDCEDTQGSILSSNVNGVIINAANVNVVLRGLSINGAGTTTGNGIRFLQGTSLTVEKMIIQNMAGTGANGSGIRFEPSTGAELNVIETTLANNGTGIHVQPTGAGGNAKVNLNNVRVINNSGTGLSVNSTGNTNLSGITVGIRNGQFDGNNDGVSAINAAGTNPVAILISDATMNNNAGAGLIGNGSSMLIRVKNSTITGNVLGLIAFGGALIQTYGNNSVIGNPTNGVANNGSFTSAIPFQ